VTRKMNPDSAKNEVATEALAAVNRGFERHDVPVGGLIHVAAGT
jgi:hypothetical protein